MNIFFDSSTFAKLFITEIGTTKTIELYFRSAKRGVSAVAWVEVPSAIGRRERLGDLTAPDAAMALSMLEDERSSVESIPVSDSVLTSAAQLVGRRQLRSLDAIQLAAALAWAAENDGVVFACSDDKLLIAAQLEGLQVVDPKIL